MQRLVLTTLAFWCCAALSVEAQPRQQEPAKQPTTKQAPADLPTPPLRVEVIENQAEANSRQAREQQADRRQIDDLLAQQSMADAANRMNGFAHLQTWLVGIGTFLLLATVYVAHQANRGFAASAERQLRAYLSQNGSKLERNATTGTWTAIVFLKNAGQTPARNAKYSISVDVREWETNDFSEYKPESANAGSLGPGCQWRVTPAFDQKDLARRGRTLAGKDLGLFVFGVVTYFDAFDTARETHIRLRKRVTNLWEPGDFEGCEGGNDAT